MTGEPPSPGSGESPTSTFTRRLLWFIYGGLSVGLFLILTDLLSLVLPAVLVSRISYNSEAYLFALVLGAYIQFGLPRVPDGARLRVSTLAAVGSSTVGVGLVASDLPSRFVTLNETAFALAVLIPYVTLRRPLSRWVLLCVPATIVLVIWAVGWAPDSWVIDQAETVGFVVLAVLTFDLFDRDLLEPGAPVNLPMRAAWYGLLVLEPVIVSSLGVEARQDGTVVGLALEFLGRIHESFIGILLIAAIIHLERYPGRQCSNRRPDEVSRRH